MSPALYDLTTLQREANGRFGFSAKNTLGSARALYENTKVLTYPRTDSRALPEDYINTVKDTLKMLEGVTGYSTYADAILKNGWSQARTNASSTTRKSRITLRSSRRSSRPKR